MTGSSDKLAKTILSYLTSRGELSLLPNLVESLVNSSQYKNSANIVVVTSAHKLDPRELETLKSYVKQQLTGPFVLRNDLDESLLAGFTLQINDTFLDASVLGKLNLLQNKLSEEA